MSLTTEQESNKIFKHYLGTSDSKEKREFFEEPINSSFTITPSQLWTYGDKIPLGDEARNEGITSLDNNGIFSWQKSDSETIPIVKRFKDYVFSAIDAGTDNAFVLLDSQGNNLQQIIPFNFSEDIYNYSLKTSGGKKIPFGVGDWVFDTFSGVLTFYGKVPVGVDHLNPPLFSFFQYVGDMGFRQDRLGLDGVVLPLTEIEIPINVSSISNELITSKIISMANKVSDDFVTTYGWDGADNNEGIALSFESLIPLIYTSTKDPVKGYDDSATAEISAIVSRVHPVQVSSTFGVMPFEISFINENATEFTSSVKTNYKLTFAGLDVKLSKNNIEGSSVLFNEPSIILRDSTEKSYVMITKTQMIADFTGEYEFTIERRDEAVLALMYWSSTKKQYWPFVTKELNTYNTGFPIAVANGKIPPSLAIGSIPLSGYSDLITPDYYGPRIHNVVISQEGGHKTKSSDYVVKNTEGYFFNDILSSIKSEYPNLTGTIFIRNGNYVVNSNTLDLSSFRDIEFVGEDKNKVIIEGVNALDNLAIRFIDDSLNTPCDFGIRNVSLKNATITLSSETGKTFVLDNVLGINCDLVVLKRVSPTIMVRNSNFDEVSFTSPEEITETDLSSVNFDKLSTFIYDNTFNTFVINIKSSSVRGNFITTASLNNGSIFFKENTVVTLATKASGAVVQSCSIQTYGATIAKNEYPAKFANGAIPIYGAFGYNHKKYVNLSEPFYYEEFDTEGNSSDLIKIKLDSEVLEINANGALTTCLKADRINVGALPFDQNAINDDLDEATRRVFDGGTLTEALSLITRYKADLISGKVPLRQLPDAVAYGGLLYKGTWCFETMLGVYPTNADLASAVSEEDLSKEDYIDTLQAGWFVIISPSVQALAENDPARVQTTIDSVQYTAGDWCVWNGHDWEKLDRAYQDACYAILAAYDPDNNPWYWKQNGATGWLDFSNVTIYEAFSRINDLFTKLIPKRPSSINDESIKLEIKTILTNYVIQSIKNNGTLNTLRNAFNINELGAKRITVGIPDSEERTGIVYYGDTSTISAIIDSTIVGQANLDYTKDNRQVVNALHIVKDFDPYSKKDFGEKFWKGILADIVPTTDVDTLGIHTYSLVIDNSLPVTITQNTNGTKTKTYELFLPFKPSSIGVGDVNTSDFDPSLPNAKTNTHACSGIYKLPFSFIVNISTTLLKALYENIKGTDNSVFIKNSVTNEYLPVTGFSVDKNNEADDADRFFDIIISNYSTTIESNRIFENFSFTTKVYDVTGSSFVETEIVLFNTRIDNSVETERLTSGISTYIYPTYNANPTNGLNQCGKVYSSSTSIRNGFYISELMKIGRNRMVDGNFVEAVNEYKWPEGKHYYLTSSFIDYLGTTGSLLTQSFFSSDEPREWMRTEEVRWVTLEKFINSDKSLSEVILKDSNGFILNFEVSEDRKEFFVQDDLSGSTNNVLIYAKLLGLDTISQTYISDSEGLNSGWIDCNLPYDGFSKPFNNGDASMYAGSSTAESKRVTFGRAVRSGKLIVRVGITKNSGIEFKGISISGVI